MPKIFTNYYGPLDAVSSVPIFYDTLPDSISDIYTATLLSR